MKQTTISQKLKPQLNKPLLNKSPKSLNNSFNYMKAPPTTVKSRINPLQKTIETPRFKLKFNFSQHSETQQTLTSEYSADAALKEYFSFGENTTKIIQTEPNHDTQIVKIKPTKKFNSPMNSTMQPPSRHTKGVRSNAETAYPQPVNNNYFNANIRSNQKSSSFHTKTKSLNSTVKQKIYPDTGKKQPIQSSKPELPSKHIQIFNNNYNIININDASSKEKRDSLKSLQKQFQQILQTQQLLENKSTYKKPVQSEKSIASIKASNKKLTTSSDNIFHASKI